MPRPARILLSQSYYHVMTRGNNLNQVFRQETDFDKYLETINKLKEECAFDLFRYCLMPNHTHFLIRTENAKDFSTFMKRMNLIYFYYFKKKYGWIGHFWQDRFKTQPVGKDRYFIQCGKYIELNPVRAGLVRKPEQYKYSSYRYYSQGIRNDLLTEDIFFNDLGKTNKERRQNYSELVIEDMVKDSYKKKSWGSGNQRYNENRKTVYHLRKNYQR